MESSSQLFIGLMSGSSLDGIDAALIQIENSQCNLLHAQLHPIPQKLKTLLDSLTRPGENELEKMCQADVELGITLSDAVNNLLKNTNLSAENITAIGSHGHTLRHYPETHATTLQIGDANQIVERTGITTVADLRRRDMAAGGQGAPLLPAFHQYLFNNNSNRVILNIGGIANVTCLSAEKNIPVTGFDTGTGNALMNAWIHHCQRKELDEAGAWARSGKLISPLLAEMLNHSFLKQPPPKSTGRDTFHLDWLRSLINSQTLRNEDIQATLLEFTARSISDAISTHFAIAEEVLICGGGVHNDFLLQRLKQLLEDKTVCSTEVYGINPDWVEAMAFAWFAYQTMQGKSSNLPAVTGASHPVILGGIYPA